MHFNLQLRMKGEPWRITLPRSIPSIKKQVPVIPSQLKEESLPETPYEDYLYLFLDNTHVKKKEDN